MLGRVRLNWGRVRDSLWFPPSVLTLLAAVLAFTVTRVDRNWEVQTVVARHWVFDGGAEGARGVLNAIASGLITVTGVVFSVTIVALQLASSQFTPRVLRHFTADRGNQLVLGVFIATFTYALLVLRTVRSGANGEEPFVPRLGVTLAVLLFVVSIGCLIFFINHSARSIQVAAILDRVTHRTLRDIRHLFPEELGQADAGVGADPPLPAPDEVPILAAEAGYLQAVDGGRLFRAGRDRELVIRMMPYIGEFVLVGSPLAAASPASAVDEGCAAEIRQAFVLGSERSPEQDVEFGIIEVSDIAIKALSPGINDPTTALRCVDRLAEILVALGSRRPPADMRTEQGRVHFIARHAPFARAAALALDQIRHFGAGNPGIAEHVLATLGRVERTLPAASRGVIVDQAEAMLRDARSRIESSAELERVQAAARGILH